MSSPDREQEEQQAKLAIEMMEAHGASLAEEAAELLAEHPDIQLVGLILDPASGVMNGLRPALEQMTGQSLAGQGFVGLVPRKFALAVLRADAPATLDWIEPDNRGPLKRLPLMAATRDGYRFGAVSITA